MAGLIITITAYVLVMVISAIPLWLAIKVMGGDAGILKVMITNIIIGLIGYLIEWQIGWLGTIISFIILLLIYKFMFDLGWVKALIVWVLQCIIAFVLMFLTAMLFGISLVIF